MKTRLLLTALSVVLLSWPKTAAAQCAAFSGRATVVQANGFNVVPVVLSDTGNLDSTGGEKDASLQDTSVLGLVSGEVLFAATIGEGSYSVSEASMGSLNLTVAGNTIGADFVIAHANAYCGGAVPTVSGSAEIDGLVVNGLSTIVTGSPNQTVPLLGGVVMILNEQIGSVQNQSASMAVNAIHIKVPWGTDVLVGSPSAGIVGPNKVNTDRHQCDFFTGGGWIRSPETGAKATFGVAGGRRSDGTFFARLEYIDHGAVPETGFRSMKVHGTGIVPPDGFYGPGGEGPNSRQIQGNANVNGSSNCGPGTTCQYVLDVADNDPGGPDTFRIMLSNGYVAFDPLTGNPVPLGAGNIELHSCGRDE